MFPHFAYVRPGSLKEAIAQLSEDTSRVHAGGTDLLTCLRDHVFAADKVVSIAGLTGLRGIEENPDGSVRIGALTTITEVAEHPRVRQMYPGLAQAASEVGSPQLRNQGTIGGNICQKPRCWYYRGDFDCIRKGGGLCYAVGGENQFHCILGGSGCYIVHPSDTAPALLALGGQAHVQGQNGTRVIDLENFHVSPEEDPQKETALNNDEILTHITLPRSGKSTRSSYRKVRARRSWDFALAGVALALEFDGDTVRNGRIVLSGVAPVPWRSREAEQVVVGKRLTQDIRQKAAKAALRQAKPMSQNSYKINLMQGVLEEELARIGQRS